MSFLRDRRRVVVAVSLLIVGAIGAYCLWGGPDRADGLRIFFARPARLAYFTENGVAVAITLEKDRAGQAWLAGTFTPTRAHFHLYSKDLPREGIDGLGRPTLLEITSSDGAKPIGPLVADQPTLEYYVEVLEQAFPVYPDGAVSLRLPIELPHNGSHATKPTELSVTYMACSAGTCLPPVTGKHIYVMIPSTTP